MFGEIPMFLGFHVVEPCVQLLGIKNLEILNDS